MIKLIFLDIDGVIATPKTIVDGRLGITPECSKNLSLLLNKTGAKLVISSSWRFNTIEETKQHLAENGFEQIDSIIGVTIRAYQYIQKGFHLGIPRGVEIKQWIDTNVHSNNGKNYLRKVLNKDFTYVILDDDSDMLLEQKDNFIQCESEEGLTFEQTFKAIHILNDYDNLYSRNKELIREAV